MHICRLSLAHHLLCVPRKGRIYYWNIFGLSLCSVCQDNIGHRLLQKHGWKLGQGLGKSLQGKFLNLQTKKGNNVGDANLVPEFVVFKKQNKTLGFPPTLPLLE